MALAAVSQPDGGIRKRAYLETRREALAEHCWLALSDIVVLGPRSTASEVQPTWTIATRNSDHREISPTLSDDGDAARDHDRDVRFYICYLESTKDYWYRPNVWCYMAG